MSNIFEENYNLLNPEQKSAVDTIYWPVMVVAWPWTWKTQIIALRAANILKKTDVNPENIFITTFTDAWVIAIRERLISFIWETWYRVNISTIHSFASDVIQTFPEKFIEYKASNSIDDVEALEILKNILDELIDSKQILFLTSDYDRHYYLRDIKSSISNLKQEWVSSSRLKELIISQEDSYKKLLWGIKPELKKYEQTKQKQESHISKLNELVLIYDKYNEHLRKSHSYDFNDMINFVLEKFRSDQYLVYHYSEKYQFVMLDEYQDTNNAQNEIITRLLDNWPDKNSPNILVVWDDDQSIYRFQWANIENMLDFSSKYKETNFIVLKTNYRSNQSILDTAKELIQNNSERLTNKIKDINKELISNNNLDNKTPNLYKAKSDIDEKLFVISKVKESLLSWIDPNDIAIIVRNNSEVIEYSNLLLQNDINVESKLKTNILSSIYVDFLIKFLHIIDKPSECDEYIIDILRSNILSISQTDIFKINRYLYIKNYKRQYNISFFDFLCDIDHYSDLPEISDFSIIIEFRDFILNFDNSSNIIKIINDLITFTWITDYIQLNWNFDDIEDVYTFFNKIKMWTSSDAQLSISKLLSKISLYKKYNYPIPRQILWTSKTWVQVLTAHSSKWLEYDTVFIPGLYLWNWDWKRVINKLKLPESISWEWLQDTNSDPIEEERRLFFVALTRAKNNLYLSFPAWIWTKPLLQSIFLEEIKDSLLDIDFTSDEDSLSNLINNDLSNTIISYWSDEISYIEEFLKNYKLSASDLNTFLSSPLDFLNRVVFKYPFVNNEFTIFGKVYHKTLEIFYGEYKKSEVMPKSNLLTNTFKLLLDRELLTHDEYKKILDKWIDWLKWFYDNYSSKLNYPLFIEYNFRHKNLFYENVPLTWTIDKIEKIWESDNLDINSWQLAFFRDKVALIDYKTWKIKTENSIKWLDRYWNKKEWEWWYFRQMMFYKLLCELDSDFIAKFDIWSYIIDFVEWKDWKYKSVEIKISDEEYSDFKLEILDIWNKINDMDFWRDTLNI